MSYIIRPIKKEENPLIAKIIRDVTAEFGAVGEGHGRNDAEVDFIYDAYNDERSGYYVVEHEGRVIGGAGIGALKGGDKDTCELRKMYLVPDVRGLGLGERLLSFCLSSAKKMGYKRCYLETLHCMPRAQALYRKLGFKQLTERMGNTGHFGCEVFYVNEF
jgi:putative acetyltransferase